MGKGLSAEEKRQRLCAFFHEESTFFSLKELEKLVPKSKGIVSNTVKDVLQSLVDDDLVLCDKVGITNVYWSFPAVAFAALEKRLETKRSEQKALESKISAVKARIQDAMSTRQNTPKREKLLKDLVEISGKSTQIKSTIEELKKWSAGSSEQKKKHTELMKADALLWTDNVLAMLSVVRSNGCNVDEVREHLGIKDDFDELAF